MNKIFMTQLRGLLEKTADQEETMEDAARAAAQSIAAGGRFFLHGTGELKGIEAQAFDGADPLPGAVRLTSAEDAGPMEMVWLFADSAESIRPLTENILENGGHVLLVTPEAVEDLPPGSFSLATGVTRGLIPEESGKRTGRPHLLVSLHLYYDLLFLLREILEENDLLEEIEE
ncbi:DUF2529 family protein [Alkalicoccus urumqiensis]|uniref:DUF2529 domain-containing protein n=1 Tax=Alkalicoccus urumqiensis TaxID=1548213 RepID=A0A2P6MHH8_ALKUR|nr:DUF2529 family protein [Alkalicoccus urumqiensis]PRO65742.1 hypothetical protein C6I21_07535 [Alkalicoccus urumqiensis]